ncbi:unnamed protein product [Notodromas monacha]|uniref:DNA-directed RNA polymerase III subunit RPC5 n=1 Tax=Notodromas monacha TaxID=399045 RepID=A0A7R9BHT6_9CRUS|nr:unnamed protein product [Notodromas monacha]CAG0915755.1 unnamed protein product [Notodromas monacha]
MLRETGGAPDDDPVVLDIPCYRSTNMLGNVYVLQYPVKPATENRDEEPVVDVKYKPSQQKLALKVALDTRAATFDIRRAEQLVPREGNPDEEESGTMMTECSVEGTLGSKDYKRYSLGIFKDGALHFTPIDGFFQMRPSFAHMNLSEKLDPDSEVAEPEGELVSVKFARHQTERAKKAEERSFAHLHRVSENEPWMQLDYNGRKSDEANSLRSGLRAQLFDPVENAMEVEDIKGALPPVINVRVKCAEDELLDGLFPVLNAVNVKSEKSGKSGVTVPQLSSQQLKLRPLSERIAVVACRAKIIRYSEACELMKLEPENEIMRGLMACCYLVQGCWVVRSDQLYKNSVDAKQPAGAVPVDILARARDYILFNFHKNRVVDKEKLKAVLRLPLSNLTALFKEVSKPVGDRPGSYEFAFPTDTDFISRYADVAERQALLWDAKFHQLMRLLKSDEVTRNSESSPTSSPSRRRRRRTRSQRDSVGSDVETSVDTVRAVKIGARAVSVCSSLRHPGQPEAKEVDKEKPKAMSEAAQLPLREPIVKNLMMGRIDPDFLGYPELSKAKLKFLNETFLPPIRDLLRTESAKNLGNGNDSGVMNEFKRLGLFGMTIPKEFGGLECSAMEVCRLLEAVGEHPILGYRFIAHCGWVVNTILKFGTDAQKREYLPAMAKGEKIGAWCFGELSSGFDARVFQTKAIQNDSEEDFIINGEKPIVFNATDADFFIVFAKTESEDHLYNKIWETTAFCVPRNTPGITVTPSKSEGLSGAAVGSVTFQNVRVSSDQILGEKNRAFEHATISLAETQYLIAALCVGQMKKILKDVVDHCVPRVSMLEPYVKHDLVRERIGRISMKTLLSESMLYATSGMIDSGEYDDFMSESVATKIFASEALFDVAVEATRQMGSRCFFQEESSYISSAFSASVVGTSNDILRIFLALRSIENAAKEMQMMVSIQRNPYDNPHVVFKKSAIRLLDVLPVIGKRRSNRLKYHLHGHLHPVFTPHANSLERLILRFPICAEMALVDSGTSIGARQVVLKTFSDISIQLYAATCGLARASRSHCIGLKQSSVEIAIACRAAEEIFDEVEAMLKPLEDSALGSPQHRVCDLGKKVLMSKDYFFEHALTHNWD